MTRLLLTGMSGTGKSSVIRELKRKGIPAIDMDDPGWSVRNAEGHQLWREDRIAEALNSHRDEPLVVSGCAENQVKFYPHFKHIVLLSAPVNLIKMRLAERLDNPYGKQPQELSEVLDQISWIEPLLRQSATREIITTIPLDQVVATVVSLLDGSQCAP